MRLFDPDTSVKRLACLEACFHSDSEIPLLRNGEDLTTSFGFYDRLDLNGKWLCYAAQIDICVIYDDLDGRQFTSKQPLKIYPRTGFGGAVWKFADK